LKSYPGLREHQLVLSSITGIPGKEITSYKYTNINMAVHLGVPISGLDPIETKSGLIL
jgi:hypothetical protein